MAEQMQTITNFLARRDVPELSVEALGGQVDLLVLLGSSLIDPIVVAARAMHDGVARRLLVSGGIGHSTPGFRDMVASHPQYGSVTTEGRAEAEIIYDILVEFLGVSATLISVEKNSTNCGTNAEESRRLVDQEQLADSTVILIQDPTMQCRSHACFERAWQDRPSTRFVSFSPFMPKVQGQTVIGGSQPVWAFDRFTSLLLGEIPRLRDDQHGYGPRGRNFFGHIDIPLAVQAAHDALARQFPDQVREAIT